MKDPRDLNEEERRAIAKQRAEAMRKSEGRKKNRERAKKFKDKKRGGPARPKAPNGSKSEDEKRAERNARVALHRARKAGKSEDEAQAAYQAAHYRAMARAAKTDEDKKKLIKKAKGKEKIAGKYRTVKEEKYKPLCGARLAGQDGIPIDEARTCSKQAGYGTDHLGFGKCKYHGGNAPNGKKSAEREMVALDIVNKEIEFYGAPLDIDPLDALAQEVRRTAGHVSWLADQVRQMHEGQLFDETIFGKKPDALIQLYQDERDRLVNVAKAAAAAGVAQRTIQLAEEQGKLMAMVIRDILWDKTLDLTPAQRQVSGEVVRRHLVALDAKMAAPQQIEAG